MKSCNSCGGRGSGGHSDGCPKAAPIAPLLGQDEPQVDLRLLPDLDCTEEEIRLGNEYAAAFHVDQLRNVVAMKNANYRCRNRQLTQALTSLAAAQKESSKRFDRIEDLETKLDAAEASLAEAQTRISELKKELGR